MDTNFVFTTVRFHCRRPHGHVAIVWANSDHVSVTVQFELHGEMSTINKAWHIEAVESRKMQTLLNRSSEDMLQAGVDYVLELGRPGGIPIQLSWTLAAETELLRQIRNGFDNLSHVHYAEAFAALEVGRNLFGKGRQGDAIDSFRIGIEELGDRYSSPDIIDDTDAKLTLAEYNLSANKQTEAVALFDRVLESRIRVYENRFKPIEDGISQL